MGILGEMKPGKPLWKVCYPAILTINWRNKATLQAHIHTHPTSLFFVGPLGFFRVPIGVSGELQYDRSHRSPQKRPESSRDLLVIIVEGVPGKRDQLIPQAAFKLHRRHAWNQAKLPEFPHPKITCLWIWIKSRSKYGCTKCIWLHIWSIAVSLQNLDLSHGFWSSQWKTLEKPISAAGAQHAVEPRLFHPNVLLASHGTQVPWSGVLSHSWDSWMVIIIYI
jgi:hypothetical protein